MVIYYGGKITPETVLKANAILERGIEAFPADWKLYFQLGFNKFFELPKLAGAGRPARAPAGARRGSRPCARPRCSRACPYWLPNLVARLLTKQGAEELAIRHLEQAYAVTSSEEDPRRRSGSSWRRCRASSLVRADRGGAPAVRGRSGTRLSLRARGLLGAGGPAARPRWVQLPRPTCQAAMSVHSSCPPRGRLQPNNERDPLPYYYRPLTGWLYRHRLQMGLDLLPAGGRRVLEVGVGSGILVPTLTAHYPEYLGHRPGAGRRAGGAGRARAARPRFQQRRPAGRPDAPARRRPSTPSSASRCSSTSPTPTAPPAAWPGALAPGGTLVTGYPMVSPLMTQAFAAIGYPNIDEDHVSPPARIAAALAPGAAPRRPRRLPPARPDPPGALPVHLLDE